MVDALKHIALIAHDNRKLDLLDWVRFDRDTLAQHVLTRPAHHRRAPALPRGRSPVRRFL